MTRWPDIGYPSIPAHTSLQKGKVARGFAMSTPPFGMTGRPGRCLVCGETRLLAMRTDEQGTIFVIGGSEHTGFGVCRSCAQRIFGQEFRKTGLEPR